MAKYKFELTDTFAGEPNYGWCRRATVELPEGVGDKWLLLAAREWAGFDGRRCTVDRHNDSADTYEIRPRGLLQVLFVSTDDTPAPKERVLAELVRWVEHCGLEKNPALAGIDMKPLENARKALLS